MQSAESLVDIHCHLLPAIDDGAKSWEESLAMAQMAVADGIGTIVVTPHQLGAFAHNSGPLIRQRTAELQTFLDRHAVPLQVLPGADVRIEPGMVAGLRQGTVLSLADKRRHVLLELPHELYLSLDRLLVQLAAVDMVGILSHPERNEGILAQPNVLRPLVDAGCLLQVTAGSLLGTFGSRVQKFSEQLIQDRLVHFVSSDAHGVKARPPLLAQACDRVAHLAGREYAMQLCCHNPAAVAAGHDLPHSKSSGRSSRQFGWWGWKKAG